VVILDRCLDSLYPSFVDEKHIEGESCVSWVSMQLQSVRL
jgi:hypothetical protein